MVLTRNRSKRNKTKTGTTEMEGTSTSAATQPMEMDQTTNPNDEEHEKRLEDLRLVASLVDWRSFDDTAGKIFYKTFGQALERKVAEYEKTKDELKGMVREACGNQKV